MGTLVSALGCYFSVVFDTPTGATIVCTFGAVLVCMTLAKAVFFKIHKPVNQEDRVAVRGS
jgi:ABC-type Mn2+/Zn2+ transport system permease subunit